MADETIIVNSSPAVDLGEFIYNIPSNKSS